MAGKIKEKAVKTTTKKSTKKPAVELKTSKETKPQDIKPNLFVCVDYPRESEVLLPGSYSIRVGASANCTPEINIDGKGWLKCRPGAGFWWYDWANYPKGTHIIEARVCDSKGNTLTSIVRSCVCKA